MQFFLALSGVVAVKCLARSFNPKVMALMNAVSGGVILGVALFHMSPDNIDGMSKWGGSMMKLFTGDDDEPYPLGFLFLALGFWALVVVEQCCIGPHSHHVKQEDCHDGNGALKTDVEQGTALEHTDVSDSTQARTVTCREPDASTDAHEQAEEAEAEGDALHRRVIVVIRKTLGSSLGGLGTLIGMCLHAFPEAMAIGAQQEAGSMAVLILAVGFHKFSASFAVASSLRGICAGSQCAWWTLSMVFVLIGPLGMGVGALLGESLEGPALSALLMFAAGTLMAVGILEMLLPSFESKSWRRRNVFAAFCACMSMAVLAIWA
jgi:zinc transporter ZupT